MQVQDTSVKVESYAQQELNQDTGYKQELNRALSLKDLIIYGLITMLPIAPIQVYGTIAKGSLGMVPLVYLVGIITMMFTAFSYRPMSQEFQISGSTYSYVQRGLNPHLGFLTGWLIVIDYLLVPSLLTLFASIWMNSIVPAIPVFLWVITFVAINTFINARGITLAAKTNSIFLVFEMIAVLLFIVFAIKFVFIDGNGMGGFSLAPIFQADVIDLGFIATATSIAVFGFLGFDVISTLSEEAKNPSRNIGRATILALLIIGIIFMAQTYMASLAHPNFEDLDVDMAFFDIAREIGGNFLYYLFLIVGVFAVGIANALVVQSAISRVLYSMSRDKVIPFSGVLSKVHPKYKTPFNATIFVGIITIIIALFGSVEEVLKLVNFGALTSFMMLNLTVFVYFFIKKKRRDVKGTFKYLVMPLVGLSILTYVWSGLGTPTYIVGFSWLFIGVVIGFIKSKGYKEVPTTMKGL